MTEPIKATERSPDAAAFAASLLHHYGFDLGDDAIEPLLLAWREQYPDDWIRLATIEALYQGRYKAISVEQILALWQRRSQPAHHFNHEFERLICDRLPQSLTPLAASTLAEPVSMQSTPPIAHLPHHHIGLMLPGFKTTSSHNNAEAMQALRTLHETATDEPLAADAELSAMRHKPPEQTYSYAVRSAEPPSQPLTHEQSELLAQTKVDTSPPSVLEPSETMELSDQAASGSAVGNEALQASAIAVTDPSSNSEPTHSTDHTITPADNGTSGLTTTPQAMSIARILQQLNDREPSAKPIFPGVGLLAQTLQPKPRLHLTARYQPLWLRDPSSKQPIHQFAPDPEASDFYSKLKLVAQVPATDGIVGKGADGSEDG